MQESTLKILVVDDDDVDRERIRRMLKAANVKAEIEEAVDADESLAILSDCDYDCIIVDYRLGATDGLSLLNDIRTTLTKKCAVIMVTGLGDEEIAAEAMRLGASDYLVKNQLKSPQLLRAILSAVHRAELEKKLHDMAHYDAMTGLVSRHLLLDRLQQVISLSSRSKKMAAIAFIDLDNFKPVNDNYGHEAGDKVLIEIADRLKKTVRNYDTVSRIGGDEFVILLTDINDADECSLLLERIRIIINVPVNLLVNCSVRITASIGVTFVNDASVDADIVLRRADHSMYQAKSSGRNRIQFFDSEEEKLQQHRRNLISAVEKGIKEGEFSLYYQPKVDLADQTIVGLESLIRWNHPERGLLTPNHFFDALHHSSLGITIGEWTLQTALNQLNVWSNQSIEINVSVNISPHHLQNYDFVSRLEKLVAQQPKVSSDQLEIEVLETASIQDIEIVIGILNRCRELGVKVALDDFGTGYASLSYLKRLPLDTLKIDKSFVINMLSDDDDYAIVESIVALSRTFGYQLIAEGVETIPHKEALQNIGCHLGQGYAIAYPMPASDIPDWLNQLKGQSNALQ